MNRRLRLPILALATGMLTAPAFGGTANAAPVEGTTTQAAPPATACEADASPNVWDEEFDDIYWEESGTYDPEYAPGAYFSLASDADRITVVVQRQAGRVSINAASGWENVAVLNDDAIDEDSFRVSELEFVAPVDQATTWTYRSVACEIDVDAASSFEAVNRQRIDGGVTYSFDPTRPGTTKYTSLIGLDQDEAQTLAPHRPVTLTGRVTVLDASGADHPQLSAGRTVTIGLTTQQKGTSQPLARTTTDPDGTYSLTVPASWSFSRTLFARVEAEKRKITRTDPDNPGFDYAIMAAAEADERPRLTVKMDKLGYKPLGKTTSWASLSGNRKGSLSYDACRPIEYRVNTKYAPAGALDMIADIHALIARQTGYTFKYLGATKEIPGKKGQSPYARFDQTLTIAWAPEKLVPGLAGSTVGRGGPGWDGAGFIDQGTVVMESGATWIERYPLSERDDLWRSLFAHEVGHAMGLDHVTEVTQIMRSGLTAQHRGVYEAGDLQGLYEQGSQVRGCNPDAIDGSQRSAAARTASQPKRLHWVLRD